MRDDFTEEVKRTLANRVASRCSNPECCASTSGPQDDPTKAINVGVAAHITAAAEGGPRYDSALTSEERRSIDNGICLCQNCAYLIDNDLSRFTKELLRAWRTVAEDRARNSIGRTAAESALDDKLLPQLELYLEPLGIVRDTYEPRMPVRSLVLGLTNVGSAIAKFATIRYKRASGLTVDNYGIDGSFGFGLPRSASDSNWETFRGGANDVIHQGETLKITKLVQRGTNRGSDGLPLPKTFGPSGQPLSQWIFSAVTFECEISAEGVPTVSVTATIPEVSITWPSI